MGLVILTSHTLMWHYLPHYLPHKLHSHKLNVALLTTRTTLPHTYVALLTTLGLLTTRLTTRTTLPHTCVALLTTLLTTLPHELHSHIFTTLPQTDHSPTYLIIANVCGGYKSVAM